MKVSYEERLAIEFGLRRRCDEGYHVVLSVRAVGKRRPAIELRNPRFRVLTLFRHGEGTIACNAIGKVHTDAAESRKPARVVISNARTGKSHRFQVESRHELTAWTVKRTSPRARLKYTSLLHHVNEDLLHHAFFDLKKTAAVGVDEVTWHDYEQDLEERITDLHGRIHRGAYRAKPFKRIYISKPDGRQRPIGITSLEDKLVQKAIVWVLQCIYEKDFLGFSYGYRPGKSQHQALDALSVALTSKKVNWVLDADVEGFFDSIDHS